MKNLIVRPPREIARLPVSNFHLDSHCWGEGVSVLQVETDLIGDHPIFEDKITHLQSRQFQLDGISVIEKLKRAIHGTAAAAILSSRKFGVAPEAKHFFLGAQGQNERQDLFPTLERFCNDEELLSNFSEGDIVSISLQLPIENEHKAKVSFPIDISKNVRLMLNVLAQRGLIVFIAAGNSNINLDIQKFTKIDNEGNAFDYCYKDVAGDSLSLKVGYSVNGFAHSEVSNFGRCVDFFSPAQSIETACYDNHQDGYSTDILDNRSLGFCRSSAATPIISGMAACVQSYALKRLGKKFTREELISILKTKATTRTGHYPRLGVFPNMMEIFRAIDEKV